MDKPALIKFLDAVSAVDEKLAEFAGWVVVVMMLTISYDVAARYIFNAPTTWSFEVNRYMLILVVFIGGAWTLPAGGHVSVDIAVDRLEQRKRQILDIATSVMAAVYILIFLIESVVFTWDAIAHNVKSTEYLAWPLWPIRSFLVIGGCLLFMEYIIRIIKLWAMLTGMIPAPQPAEE